MHPAYLRASRHRRSASFTLSLLILAAVALPAAGQTVMEWIALSLTKSTARGIDDRGWDPLTIVGTTTDTKRNATCWIRVSQQWSTHVLPGLDPSGESWANDVVHTTVSQGEWTAVVGAAVDGGGATRPMQWDNVTNTPWTPRPLPTLSAGDGEARAIFHPEGVPLRALVGGWSDELPPMAASRARAEVNYSTAMVNLRMPVIWETTATGERLLRPDFGAGLEAVVNDIGSTGYDGFTAVGGGQDAVGAWMPQRWRSTDNGETWTNDPLPLPVGAASGEAVDFDYDGLDHLVVSGWGESTTGMKSPLLWELDLSMPGAMWTIHELPLPVGDEAGTEAVVRKKPGRTTYASIALQSGGGAEMGLWLDDAAGGWTMYLPSDYLTNPQDGTPIAPGGIDAFARIAVTGVTAPPTASATVGAASAQGDTVAAVLIPTTAPTGTGGPARPPRALITLSASPNPFNPAIYISYTLPRDARVTVELHDAAGRLVRRFNEGQVRAGEFRNISWDGTARNGRRVASGVYFVRVETPYDIATLKIVRTK